MKKQPHKANGVRPASFRQGIDIPAVGTSEFEGAGASCPLDVHLYDVPESPESI